MKAPECSFAKGSFAIIDTETTGTSPTHGRIIEVGIIRVERGEVAETFQSLVNPECPIQPVIEQVTGISSAELAGAPVFGDIAERVGDLLQGAVFVAHNARFDYGFIKNEYKRLGRRFTAQCLCTVSLSKKIFPGYARHDLSSIIQRFGITCEQRHRAFGDASATYDFLRVIREQEGAERLDWGIRMVMEGNLPGQLDRNIIRSLPEAPGVYLFYGPNNELLYVGKSKNVRRRVMSHFALSSSSGKEMRMCSQTHAVETQTTAGELGALLLESRLIKDLQPIHNRMARLKRKLVILRREVDNDGYAVASMEAVDAIDPGEVTGLLTVFKNRSQAREFLATVARDHELCHKLLGLEKTSSCCFQYHLHRCHGACMGSEDPAAYNARFEAAFAERRIHAWPYPGGILIEEKGENEHEGEAFLIDHWCLISSVKYSDDGFRQVLPGMNTFDYDSYKILARFLRDPKNRKRVRPLSGPQYASLLGEIAGQTAGFPA